MLVLGCKAGDGIIIKVGGDIIKMTRFDSNNRHGSQAQFGFEAPLHVKILRESLYRKEK